MSANKVAPAIQEHIASPKPESKSPIDRRYYFAVMIGAGAAIAAILLSLLVIRPLFNKSLSTAKDLQYRTQEASDLNNKLTNLKQLKENFLALGSDTENKVLVAMPSDTDEPHITSVLATVAGQSGVRLTNINYQVSSTPAPAATPSSTTPTTPGALPSVQAQILPVSLTVTGPYAGIATFLGQIENAPRVMDVTSVNISGNTGSGNVIGTTATIQVNAYYNPVTVK